MILGTCQFNRNSECIKSLYKAWSGQTIPFDRFFFANYNLNSFSFPGVESFHHPLKGVPNVPYMINKGIKKAIEFNDKHLEYCQLIGDDTYPASNKYFEVCIDLIKEYDIIVPKLVRAEAILESFLNIDDVNYQSFIQSADPKYQIFYNEGSLFLKTEVIYELNGWDETYIGWGCEDKDFLERAKQTGYKIYYLDPPYHLVHSFHERMDMNSLDAYVNRKILQLTKKGKLPIKRMPDDWGIPDCPRVNFNLRNSIKKELLI